MPNKREILAELPVFAGLYDDELDALAAITQEYELDKDAVIAYQRDPVNALYIVREGRLFARAVDNRGIVRDSRSYLPGNYFDDAWLFEPHAHPATIKGAEPGRLLLIEGPDFIQFLEQFPDALERLEPVFDPETGEVVEGLSIPAWEEAEKTRLKADPQSAAISLLPDELVEYHSRRSRWYLLVRVATPFAGLVVAPLVASILLGGQPPDTVWYSLRWPIVGIIAFLFLALTIFRWLDWLNDYFVITNKHLAHREFSLNLLTFGSNINKIPIDQIQSVEIERPTFISNLFNFGTARITTASHVGIVYFDNIDNPMRVQQILNDLRQRVQAVDAGMAQAAMRRSIESYFQVQPAYQRVTESEDEAELAVQPKSEQTVSIWRAITNRYRWRVEENGVITYRKHFFVLLKVTALPVLLGLGLLAIVWILLFIFQFPLTQILLFSSLFFLANLGWFIWKVEDWRNDTFQLTPQYVIDIDRKPFGFGESRKQAELSNVQNINSDKAGLLPNIFNYGHVIIETAGATADIVFEYVSNPNRVQSEVFKRRDEYRRLLHQREGEQRRKEYAVLLDVYQQATEQARIPRRTPAEWLAEEEEQAPPQE